MTANYPDGSTPSYADAGGETSTGAKDQAKQAAGTAANEGKHIAGVAQGEAQKVASEAKSQVHSLLSQTMTQVEDQSRTQRDRIAETLKTFGDDLEQMASQGESSSASSLAREVADRAHGLSSHLDGREPRELLDDVREFARRRPGVFLLGALTAGVVAGRLARGAKAAQNDAPEQSSDAQTGSAAVTASIDTSDRPSSGPITTNEGGGTDTGTPLAGVGAPESDPVYPGGAGVTSDAGARGGLS